MVAGNWLLTLDSPDGAMEATLTVEVNGSILTGYVTDAQNKREDITDGVVSGDDISFKVKLPTPMGGIKFKFTAKIDGDTLSGTAKMAMGSFKFTGKLV